jgi:hypothetical protein
MTLTKLPADSSSTTSRRKEWVTIRCHQCSEDFQVTPAWARGGRRKYCSRRCLALATVAGKRKGIKHRPDSIQRMKDAATGRYLGESSPVWKGGRFHDQHGYVSVAVSTLTGRERELAEAMAPKHAKGRPYIREHRLVMATMLDRPLQPFEVVHHHNGVKDDNSPTNLFLRDQSSHTLEHRMVDRELARMRERVAELEAENADLRSRLT